MGSPLKTLVALVMVLAMIVFVCTDVAYAEETESPPPLKKLEFKGAEAEFPDSAPPTPPPQMDRPKAILPEEPIVLDLGNEPEDDSKNKSGKNNPKIAPTTAKREYHRKILFR